MSSSLGDRLAQLSLDIDDKTKTIRILHKLIKEQSDRHSSEAEKYGKEKQDYFEKCIKEYKEHEVKLHNATESLKKKKDLLANGVKTLAEEKQVGLSVVLITILNTQRSVSMSLNS